LGLEGLPLEAEPGPGGEAALLQRVEDLPGKPRVEVAQGGRPLPPVAEGDRAPLVDPLGFLHPKKPQGALGDFGQLLPPIKTQAEGGRTTGSRISA